MPVEIPFTLRKPSTTDQGEVPGRIITSRSPGTYAGPWACADRLNKSAIRARKVRERFFMVGLAGSTKTTGLSVEVAADVSFGCQ
jgi:hypothetical protein